VSELSSADNAVSVESTVWAYKTFDIRRLPPHNLRNNHLLLSNLFNFD
jgi:hypothetical protein